MLTGCNESPSFPPAPAVPPVPPASKTSTPRPLPLPTPQPTPPHPAPAPQPDPAPESGPSGKLFALMWKEYPNRCLDVEESKVASPVPPMRMESTRCTLNGNQFFQVRREGWQAWRLWPQNEIIWTGDGGHDPYCLGLKDNLAEDRNIVQIQVCDHSSGQDWYHDPVQNTLSPATDTTLCLQPLGTEERAAIQLVQCLHDDSNKQRWDLIDTESSVV